MNFDHKLIDDGVVLIRDIIDHGKISSVHKRYKELDSSLTRTEIETDKPIIVFWRHVIGEKKRISNFDEFPELWDLIVDNIIPNLRKYLPQRTKRLQLMETIIFNKPSKVSNTLNWHQDVAYFLVEPNNQIAIWIPFEEVNFKRGAMNYALGSHATGIKAHKSTH